jgi:outer membrane protein OmpA-like peptidoglycan-associated protein
VGAALVLEGVNFATGKADILPESESVLEKVYNGLADHPEVEVEIQGHTDNTGNRASNMTLSQSRAESVRSWMMAKGIAPGRMTAKGFGPDKPIAPNTTPEGRAKNRRIEFLRTK